MKPADPLRRIMEGGIERIERPIGEELMIARGPPNSEAASATQEERWHPYGSR
jgi:hypothetical protein